MATVSGTPVESISSLKGVTISSISSISGIATSTIPGWPGACVVRTFGYVDLSTSPIAACEAFLGQPINYLYNESAGILYGEKEPCGGAYAPEGYYSDGVNIYQWTTNEKASNFQIIAACAAEEAAGG